MNTKDKHWTEAEINTLVNIVENSGSDRAGALKASQILGTHTFCACTNKYALIKLKKRLLKPAAIQVKSNVPIVNTINTTVPVTIRNGKLTIIITNDRITIA